MRFIKANYLFAIAATVAGCKSKEEKEATEEADIDGGDPENEDTAVIKGGADIPQSSCHFDSLTRKLEQQEAEIKKKAMEIDELSKSAEVCNSKVVDLDEQVRQITIDSAMAAVARIKQSTDLKAAIAQLAVLKKERNSLFTKFNSLDGGEDKTVLGKRLAELEAVINPAIEHLAKTQNKSMPVLIELAKSVDGQTPDLDVAAIIAAVKKKAGNKPDSFLINEEDIDEGIIAQYLELLRKKGEDEGNQDSTALDEDLAELESYLYKMESKKREQMVKRALEKAGVEGDKWAQQQLGDDSTLSGPPVDEDHNLDFTSLFREKQSREDVDSGSGEGRDSFSFANPQIKKVTDQRRSPHGGRATSVKGRGRGGPRVTFGSDGQASRSMSSVGQGHRDGELVHLDSEVMSEMGRRVLMNPPGKVSPKFLDSARAAAASRLPEERQGSGQASRSIPSAQERVVNNPVRMDFDHQLNPSNLEHGGRSKEQRQSRLQFARNPVDLGSRGGARNPRRKQAVSHSGGTSSATRHVVPRETLSAAASSDHKALWNRYIELASSVLRSADESIQSEYHSLIKKLLGHPETTTEFIQSELRRLQPTSQKSESRKSVDLASIIRNDFGNILTPGKASANTQRNPTELRTSV